MLQSSSCQELLRASRPGFPEGLKVLVVMKDSGLHASTKKVLEEIGYKVTTVCTLDKGLTALESTASETMQFDVALVEAKQVEPLLGAVEGVDNSINTTAAADAAAAATKADASASALSERFNRLAREVAIVLMHEEDDVSSKSYMIEAIKVGVVDVVKFPLAKQSMRTLWQHAVRKMIRQQGRADGYEGKAAGTSLHRGKRSARAHDSSRAQQASNSSGSSASEERVVKRQSSSPKTVLEQDGDAALNAESSGAGVACGGRMGGGAEKGAAAAAGAEGAAGGSGQGHRAAAADGVAKDAVGADAAAAAARLRKGGVAVGIGANGGAFNASGSGSVSVAKLKPQARSTQQWKAAEQRGRRLAIKPHTAVQAQNSANGQVMGGPQGMGYWQPAPGQPGAVMGQAQTMTINGQQVWVPMNSLYHPQQQQQQQQNGPSGQQQQNDQQQRSNFENNNNGTISTNNGTIDSNGNSGQQPQHPQAGGYVYSPGGVITAVGPNGQPLHLAPMNGGYMNGPVVLVQQSNGQQMYMQHAPGMQMVNGQMVMQGQGQWAGGQQHQQQGYYQVQGDAPQQPGDGGKGGQQQNGSQQHQQQQQQQNGFFTQSGQGMPPQMQPQPMPKLDPMDQLKSQPLPLGLNLKRTNSLQQILGGSLADVIGSPPGSAIDHISTSMFNDVEMLDEDALDAILAQAKDGNLLSFDGMDEAMLEAAAASGNAAGDLGLIRA